jgi:hypothetical protein
MPRRKQPKPHEVIHLPCDPSVPFENRKALYTRLSDDDLDKVSHTSQQNDARLTFGLTQTLPAPELEGNLSIDGLGRVSADRGYVVVAIYRDWQTGVDPRRLALKQLIKDAHAREHSGVLFRDDDRLFRGVVGGMPVAELHSELPEYTFEPAVGVFSIDDFAIHAYLSGKERDKTRQRTMAGRRMRAAQGRAPHGKLPWWLVRDPDNGQLLTITGRAELMREAIRRFVSGERISLVVDWLNSVTPEEDRWSGHRLRDAFRNPALYGRLDYGRSLQITQKRGDDIVVIRREVNPKAVPFHVTPLLHEKEQERNACRLNGGCPLDALVAFDTLNDTIKQRNQRGAGTSHLSAHPLRRRVICPCGWRMGYMPKVYKGRERGYGYLRCTREAGRGQSVVKDYPACPISWLGTNTLWPRVQAAFVDAVQHPDCVVHEVEAQILAEVDELMRKIGSVEEMTQKLSDLEDREDELYSDLKKKLISETIYQRRRTRIEAERRELAEARRLLLDRQVMLDRFAVGTRELRAALQRAQELDFDGQTLEDWTRLFDQIVQDVVLDAQGAPTLRWKSAA